MKGFTSGKLGKHYAKYFYSLNKKHCKNQKDRLQQMHIERGCFISNVMGDTPLWAGDQANTLYREKFDKIPQSKEFLNFHKKLIDKIYPRGIKTWERMWELGWK